MWPIFPKILWVDKHWNMVTIRTESPNGTYFSFKSGNISNGESEKNIFRYIHIH